MDVIGVTQDDGGGFRIHAGDGRYWDEKQAPILGTGFVKGGGAQQVAEHWEWDEDDLPAGWNPCRT
ncbi:hypothetical protein ABRZ03_11625 [Castellaniella ginsengisoli]|uniref:Uncharacterized protein n=1 Tax=Castellaniella ginsengisoli TaxID=546114 RepID=A0AB39E7Z6_9BURK